VPVLRTKRNKKKEEGSGLDVLPTPKERRKKNLLHAEGKGGEEGGDLESTKKRRKS